MDYSIPMPNISHSVAVPEPAKILPEALRAPQPIAKKALAGWLFPGQSINTRKLRAFFTDERLDALGITVQEYRKCKNFNLDQSAIIRAWLISLL
jgi:hypothetical protein